MTQFTHLKTHEQTTVMGIVSIAVIHSGTCHERTHTVLIREVLKGKWLLTTGVI